MISKEDAKEKLKKAGYNVVDDNSVLTILIPEKASVKNNVKSVKEFLLKIDYRASFGVKQHTFADNADDIVTEEKEDFKDIDISDIIEETEDIIEEEPDKENVIEKSVGDSAKNPVKNSTKKSAKSSSKKSDEVSTDSSDAEQKNEEEFFDEEDENFDDDAGIKLDDYDMDMMLNEKSIQFSLEDFGLI